MRFKEFKTHCKDEDGILVCRPEYVKGKKRYVVKEPIKFKLESGRARIIDEGDADPEVIRRTAKHIQENALN